MALQFDIRRCNLRYLCMITSRMKKSLLRIVALFLLLPTFAFAAEEQASIPNTSFASCSRMEIWDISMGMCMPLAMEGMPMKMLMLHGNAFAVGITESGSRARSAFAAPNMFMADIGTSLGANHYLNLDFMGTVERWTFPYQGYPELLQIGEANREGISFLDAQHPHSSPVMGLTFSDTIRFSQNAKDNIKVFFAPRGESTDGPIAFMHRQTGMVNPDAPLGHHVGQDVGHISSTVLGASLAIANTRIELSAFNGVEPEPDAVNLTLGKPNSAGFRVIQEFSPELTVMASAAFIKNPEPSDPDISSISRYSTSLYFHRVLSEDWKFHNTLIYGLITKLDHASSLSSFAEEFLWEGEHPRIWGRLEVLQRTGSELQIPSSSTGNLGKWIGALTLGYTHAVKKWESAELGLGGSVTLDRLPAEFLAAYGGQNPITGKIFIQLSGMQMWDL